MLREQIAWLRLELERKDELIVGMRREGYDPPPQIVTPTGKQPTLDPIIESTIEDMVRSGLGSYEDFASQAVGYSADMTAEEIAEDMRRGSQINPHFL